MRLISSNSSKQLVWRAFDHCFLYCMKLKDVCLPIVVESGCHWKVEGFRWLMLVWPVLQPNKKTIASSEEERSAVITCSQPDPGTLSQFLPFSCVKWEDIYLFTFILQAWTQQVKWECASAKSLDMPGVCSR